MTVASTSLVLIILTYAASVEQVLWSFLVYREILRGTETFHLFVKVRVSIKGFAFKSSASGQS